MRFLFWGHYYSDFAEKGYYNRIIAGNINQVLKVDSVVCDFNAYPLPRTRTRDICSAYSA